MTHDDVISILFRNIIHQIFPYNQKHSFWLFISSGIHSLLFQILIFFKILSSSVFISVYSFWFKIFHFFINEAVAWSQIFHSFQTGKYPPLMVSPPFPKIALGNTLSPPPPQSSYCFYGIPVLRNLFCFNKLA